MQEQAKDAISKENFDLTEAVPQLSGSVHSTIGRIGVVWASHGNKLIRCHPTHLRRCSEREVSIVSLKGLVQISMPTSVTELTNALSPGQYEDLSTNLPTRDDLRCGEVDLEEPPTGQETIARSLVPLLSSGIVVDPLQNTPTRLPSRSDLLSEPVRRYSDVPIDESSVALGSMQISPRDLTRSQGELVRSSLENPNPTTVRRRIVGKRTVILPEPAGIPEALEPSESDTKKRRVESFDESVDWFQRERSSTAWLTNSSDERDTFGIGGGDLLEPESPFVESHRCGCQRDCQTGNRLRFSRSRVFVRRF